jgi:hypothetical protein
MKKTPYFASGAIVCSLPDARSTRTAALGFCDLSVQTHNCFRHRRVLLQHGRFHDG